jgi:hypothetical protein
MRILWHSVGPQAPTGYGQQTALWVPRLAELGHEIAISDRTSLRGMTWWRPGDNGGPAGPAFRVYPSSAGQFGTNVIQLHAEDFSADLVITLQDTWALGPEGLNGIPRVACWSPVDTEPLGGSDNLVLNASGAIPLAMSGAGLKELRNAGYDALYVPHGIDTATFSPGDREDARDALRIGDRFVIGMNATNRKGDRKCWLEQMTAFAALKRKHRDVYLYAHTMTKEKDGYDLRRMADDLNITGFVRFSPQYQHAAGMITPRQMAFNYCAMDLFSGCSTGEGFGLPLVEAAACGVPTVTTAFGAMLETGGSGWFVGTEDDRYYEPGHRAERMRPRAKDIYEVYMHAYEKGADYAEKQAAARPHAERYEVTSVLKSYWMPVLDRLEELG